MARETLFFQHQYCKLHCHQVLPKARSKEDFSTPMPGSALKGKKVIDPTEEKKEPEVRGRCANWKNATFMLLPKSIVTARSCCSCRLLIRLWESLRSGEGFGYSRGQGCTCKLYLKGVARWRKPKPLGISYISKKAQGVVDKLPALTSCHFGGVTT